MLITTLFVSISKKFNKDISAATYTNITSQVTIGNSAPSFTSGPAENTASTNTAPTSIGGTVQFNATATDANGESYYLIVCSTDSVTAGSGGSYPSCGATLYCRNTTAVSSGSSTSCSYTTVAGDAWSNAWYAFVCDNNSTVATCSASSQGSGTPTGSESPFFVNHPPVFTVIGSNTPQNPGSNLTWTTTASDPDTGSTVELLVCKTNAMSSGACTGGNWCTSTAVASNPTCSYSIPTPTADGSYDTWVFVVDQFDLGASGTGTKQGSESDFTVNNVAPVITNIYLNGGNSITLTEATTTTVYSYVDVFDANGCRNKEDTAGEFTDIKGYLYRSGVTYDSCDTSGEANANNCYPEIICYPVIGEECTAGTNYYRCRFYVEYYADPTVSGTRYSTQNWLTSVKATDDDSASVTTQITTGVELNSLVSASCTPTLLDYGTLVVGASNDPLDKVVTCTNTGNVLLDQKHKATGSYLCTNYPTCTGGTPIPITYQKYAHFVSTSYSSGVSLSETETIFLACAVPKQTTTTPTSSQSYWGIYIPTGTVSGTYQGINVISFTGHPFGVPCPY